MYDMYRTKTLKRNDVLATEFTYKRTVTRVAYSLIRYAGRARDIAREQTGRYGGEFLKQVSPLWN